MKVSAEHFKFWTRALSTTRKLRCPGAFEKFFYSLHRQPTQTLLSYTTEHREHLREIEKFGVKIPTSVSGWLLLRRAGLTMEQRQLVQTHVGTSMEEVKIEEAMFLLFGQDYRRTTEPSRGFRGKGASTGAPRWSSRKGHAYNATDDAGYEDDYEYEYDEVPAYDTMDDDAGAPWETDEIYWQDDNWDEAAYHEQTDEQLPDEEYEEVFATYLDARRRFAELKAARGFWPVMAVPPSTTGSSTMSPTSSPSASTKGKPTKGKSKGGKGKGKGGQRPFFQKGSASQRASSAAAVCLRCGQSGHYSDSCPNPPTSRTPTSGGSQSPAKKTKTTESYAYVVTSCVDAGNSKQALRGTLDNGASSVLIGHNTLMKNLQNLHNSGRDLKHLCFRPVDKTFHFGGDASSRSEWSIHLPVTIGGSFGRIQVFVPGDTPFLLGRPILKHFKIQIDYAADKIAINGGSWTSTTKGTRDEYLLDLHNISDDWCQDWDFDLMTDDTIDNFQYQPHSDTITLEEYLHVTQLPPPELTFNTD